MAKTGAISDQILDKSIKSEDLDSDLQLSGSTFITGSLNVSSSDAFIKGKKLYVERFIELSGSKLNDWSEIEDSGGTVNLEKKLFVGNDNLFGSNGDATDIVRENTAPFTIFTSASNFRPDHYRFVLNDNGIWDTKQIGIVNTYNPPFSDRQHGFYRYLVIASSTSSLETHIDYCTVTIKQGDID